MGIFSDGFVELKKASEPLYKAPKSIQETIEIMKVAENGIFEVAKNRYSKCYRFSDINYTTTNEEEQIDIFEIKVMNLMKPDSIGTTILNLQPGTPMYEDYKNGRFELPTYRDILREERELLENIGQDYPLEVWTGGFLPGERFIVGNFPEDRERILKQISERRITNRMPDQKLMVAGGL